MIKIMENRRGYTLVELIFIMGILGVLIASVAIFINPVAMLQKARDSEKRNDVLQVKNALDSYYHDNGKFPVAEADLQAALVTDNYIKKIPSTSSTVYFTDSSTNPQWYMYLWRKEYTQSKDICNISCMSAAQKQNYICAYGGNVDPICTCVSCWSAANLP